MPRIRASRLGIVRPAALVLLAWCGLAPAFTAPAHAQFVAVVVNGEPITNYDVEQRAKLIQLSSRRTPTRKEVIDELIDEKLKLQLIRRYSIEGIDKDVDNAYANMARRMRATPKEFTEQLARAGIQPDTLKSRIKAEITWNQVIRGRFHSSFQISDKDLMAQLEGQKAEDAQPAAYDYTLRPILFIVPRGSPPAVVEARRREAESLRARFQGCEEGLMQVRGLRDVAVRAAVVKSSADLSPALREVLEKTEIGRLTAPESTLQGIEVYALCGKRPSASDNAPGKREAREKLIKERFDARAAKYLQELRSQAMIEYR
jgi:peptidyl-prolyl cis-trans isomerase SurA